MHTEERTLTITLHSEHGESCWATVKMLVTSVTDKELRAATFGCGVLPTTTFRLEGVDLPQVEKDMKFTLYKVNDKHVVRLQGKLFGIKEIGKSSDEESIYTLDRYEVYYPIKSK